MKLLFEEPVIQVELFCVEDVVTTSGFIPEPGDDETPVLPISGAQYTQM